MDFSGGEDVEMHDGQVIASTEPTSTFRSLADLSPTSDPDAVPTQRGPSQEKLKGDGAKREGSEYDFLLTKNTDAPRPAKFASLPYASAQTGLLYDVRMRFHVDSEQTENDMHPEDPRRIHAIYESFVDAGLAWRPGGEPSNGFYMGRIETRQVTKAEVCRVHTEAHWDWVQNLFDIPEEDLADLQQHPGSGMDSVYLSHQTPFCAALSAGGAIEVCRAILNGKVKNGFAIIRPPGHHAEREDAKGFCFFDNVSIATKVCQDQFKDTCRKVLILDWDVHHGNGIQQANYDDPNVLYISLHVHERGRFYPEMSYRDRRPPYGDHAHCGEGAGLGKNVNIPWSKKGMGDADYIYAFQQIVMPIALEFQPDLVIIAAGFDAAEGDMLGGCKVTPAGYAHMTHMLMSLANGRVAVCLEGGYNLDSIARSATAVARTLMGEPPERLVNASPTASGVDDIKLVLRQQSRFWSSLYPKDPSAKLAGPLHGVRMNGVVRRWQAETLWEEYEMLPLSVFKQPLSEPFKTQVLATPNYTQQRPLLLILHDPPEIIASPDPVTGKIELHNTWLTDIVKTYVDWAVKQGFAVIDVNLPKHVADADTHDEQEHESNDTIEFRTKETTHLLTYLWDNYIGVSDSEHIFLMGTNTGHGAIINFIKENEQRAVAHIKGAISFVEDVPLQSFRSATNDTQWYCSISQIFVASEHGIWHMEDPPKRPKKRFGTVERSKADSMTEMLIEHKKSVQDFLKQRTTDWVDIGDTMDTTEVEATSRLPPLGNFAPAQRARPESGPLSPSLFAPANGGASAGRTGSPKTPPISNWAAKPRTSRSPFP